MKTTHLVSSVLAISLIAPIFANASELAASPPGSQSRHAARATETDFAGTIVQTGSGGGALPNDTYDAVDKAKTLDCKSSKGCLIVTQAMVQAVSATGGAEWAICTKVDGVGASPSCPYQGLLSTNYQTAVDLQSVAVSTGKHSIQTYVYPQSNAATLGYWQTEYTLLQQ